jgi:hypothetical protein
MAQDISLDGIIDGPAALAAFIFAASTASRELQVLAENGEPVSAQVTFITLGGRRIAAIVPPDAGEIYLEDTLGMPLDSPAQAEGNGT